MLEPIQALVTRCGPVGLPLVALGLCLWALMVLRWQHLRTFARASAPRPLGLDHYRRLIGVMVKAAPLLGLLGTVSGMIHAFASLQHAAEVTSGVGAALLSTQLGLAIAIPAMVVAHRLDRYETDLAERIALQEKIYATR